MWRQSAKSSLINFVILFITGLSDFQSQFRGKRRSGFRRPAPRIMKTSAESRLKFNPQNVFFYSLFKSASNWEKCVSPISIHFSKVPINGRNTFLLFIGSFERCLEMGEMHFSHL